MLESEASTSKTQVRGAETNLVINKTLKQRFACSVNYIIAHQCKRTCFTDNKNFLTKTITLVIGLYEDYLYVVWGRWGENPRPQTQNKICVLTKCRKRNFVNAGVQEPIL